MTNTSQSSTAIRRAPAVRTSSMSPEVWAVTKIKDDLEGESLRMAEHLKFLHSDLAVLQKQIAEEESTLARNLADCVELNQWLLKY